MPNGLVVTLLLLSAYFGFQTRALVAAGGVRLPFAGGAITRVKDPITFWGLVVFYGAMTVITALGGVTGAIYRSAI